VSFEGRDGNGALGGTAAVGAGADGVELEAAGVAVRAATAQSVQTNF
jgi:hypothetical protein